MKAKVTSLTNGLQFLYNYSHKATLDIKEKGDVAFGFTFALAQLECAFISSTQVSNHCLFTLCLCLFYFSRHYLR